MLWASIATCGGFSASLIERVRIRSNEANAMYEAGVVGTVTPRPRSGRAGFATEIDVMSRWVLLDRLPVYNMYLTIALVQAL